MAEGIEVWRIFSKDDGTSSMEKIDVPMPDGASKLLAGPGVVLRRMSKDMVPSWHVGPRRQMLATIAGEGEIETGDGQVLVVRPGVITVIEDLTGVGHLTRGRGDSDRFAIVWPIDDATTLP
jgi:hypothetical protein